MLSGLPPFDPREADRLLKRLLELPPDERTAALEDACKDDALRAAVRALLDGAAAPHGPFDPGSDTSVRLWSGLAAEAAERESPLATGVELGSYRILGEIARGGMAVVYRAERIDGELSREVAVKVLKLGLDTEEVVLRFEQERQILADLEHPGIARLYDAGRTAGGRPYFVMELVEGAPIDRYCDELRLSIDERLDLFCSAVAAVEYAHQNLVVHRDLKPSNILVTEAGEVKLLDFGIARLMDVEAAGAAAPATRTVSRMMTPEYASPEQVRGERVTTASDVYQLGLLLYELLSGQRAYLLAEGGLGALERAICEEVPTRPSTAVSRTATRGARVGAGKDDSPIGPDSKRAASGAPEGPTKAVFRVRRSTPARLRRRLRGDLDNIVLKALRKEPERRYPTADRLAQDVRRHLAGLPVTARPDTWRYRGRKFLRRHALGASAAGAVLILAIGSGAYYTDRIQRERDRAEAERAVAQAERDRTQVALAKAERMSGLLGGLFRSSDPRQARGADLTARELLDRGVDQVERELAEQPLVQAEMLQVLGRTYMELGLYGSADRLLGRALELRRRPLGAEHREVAETLADIGLLRERQGRYEEARELLEEAWRIRESLPRADDEIDLSDLLVRLAMTYRRLGEYDEAGIALEHAQSFQDTRTGEGSERVASILTSLGLLRAEMGSLDQAEQAFRRSLQIREERLGADDPQIAWSLMNLAGARQHQGKSEDVESMYRRGLAILENAYGADHRPVNIALNNLGQFLVEAGRADEATELLERSLGIAEQTAGPHHPETAFSLASLAGVRLVEGRLHEARQHYERCVTIREAGAASRPFDPLLIHCLVRLGRIEAELGDRAAAGRQMAGALAYWRNATQGFDPQLAPDLVDLARWLADHERCSEAVPILTTALRVFDARYSPHPVVPKAEALLTTCTPAAQGP